MAKPNPGKAPRWTDAEEATLRENWPDKTLEEVAALLPNKTPHAIEAKASHMRVGKSREYHARNAERMPKILHARCVVCNGRIDMKRQELGPGIEGADFIVVTRGGGRGSGFFPVPEESMTLEAALRSPEHGAFARRYLEQLQRIAAEAEALQSGGERPANAAGTSR